MQSTLEDWILVGLRFGHQLPIVGGINPNSDIRIRIEKYIYDKTK